MIPLAFTQVEPFQYTGLPKVVLKYEKPASAAVSCKVGLRPVVPDTRIPSGSVLYAIHREPFHTLFLLFAVS